MIGILFVHSDQKLVEVYHPRLSRHFSVDSAFDGLTALRKLKLTKPGLIVSDYRLPKLSGLSLLKFVRTTNNYSAIPFIFLTGSQVEYEALGLGANDWVDLSVATPDLLIEKIYGQLKLNRHGLQINRT
jgi:CheY-like chemotaxis protein